MQRDYSRLGAFPKLAPARCLLWYHISWVLYGEKLTAANGNDLEASGSTTYPLYSITCSLDNDYMSDDQKLNRTIIGSFGQNIRKYKGLNLVF